MYLRENAELAEEIETAIKRAIDCEAAVKRIMEIIKSHEDDIAGRVETVERAVVRIANIAEKAEVLFKPITFYGGQPGEVINLERNSFIQKYWPRVKAKAVEERRKLLEEYKELAWEIHGFQKCTCSTCSKIRSRMEEIQDFLCG